MLDDKDIKKLKEALSTKEDLGRLRVEINQNFAKVVAPDEFDQFKVEIKQDLDGLCESVQALTVSVDKLEY